MHVESFFILVLACNGLPNQYEDGEVVSCWIVLFSLSWQSCLLLLIPITMHPFVKQSVNEGGLKEKRFIYGLLTKYLTITSTWVPNLA